MTSGNPILDKNLECIERYNPELVETLRDMKSLKRNIELIETDLKEPNLMVEGVPLHSQRGAEAEAKRTLIGIKNTGLSIHVLFGIGLGYLFKEFCEQSNGIVILYEPTLEVLRVTLELVDFTKELSQDNVFVVHTKNLCSEVFGQFSRYKGNSSFFVLDSYRDYLYRRQIQDLTNEFKVLAGSYQSGYEYLKTTNKRSIKHVLQNLEYTLKATPLNEVKDTYKGKTALVVSAGPTLDRNIQTIKKNRDKVLIFCVGPAFKTLITNGITPDFVNVIEINDVSGQFKDLDTSDVKLITEAFTNNSLYRLPVKQNLLYVSPTVKGNQYWSKITGIDILPYYTRGTVAYAALGSAKMLGCEKLILVGQDLAFIDNQCYSSDASYSNMVFEIDPKTGKPVIKVKDKEKYLESFIASDDNSSSIEELKEFAERKLERSNAALFTVRGITGEMLPTMTDYAQFVDHLVTFAENNPELELINTSMVGAQIDGFKNIPLEQALEGTENIVNRVDKFPPHEFDLKTILENLDWEKQKLKKVLKEFDLAKDYFYKYKRDLKRNNLFKPELFETNKKIVQVMNILVEVPEANDYVSKYIDELTQNLDFEASKIQFKYLKLLFELYTKIDKKYVAYSITTEQSGDITPEQIRDNAILFQALSYNDKLEVDFTIKFTKDFGLVDIVVAFATLDDYFANVEQNILETMADIEEIEKRINELAGLETANV